MNKQIFLSLALLALVSFSGAMGGNADTNSTNSSTSSLQVEKTVTTELKKDSQEQKTDASGVRAAFNGITTFCSDHQMKLGILAALIAGVYVTYKVCPWFKNWVDGTTTEAERTQVLPWGAIN